MAIHFARGRLACGGPFSPRLPAGYHQQAQLLPEHQRNRFLASRSLLAELMFMLYGINILPPIRSNRQGRPGFVDDDLVDFSLSYAGNIVGVAITTEGYCGLDLELQRTLHPPQTGGATAPEPRLTSQETTWIANQNDPQEAKTQLVTLRRSLFKLPDAVAAPRVQLLPGAGKLRVENMPHAEAISDAEDVLVWAVAASTPIDKLSLWEFESHWQNLPDVPSRYQNPQARLIRFTSLPAEKPYILS